MMHSKYEKFVDDPEAKHFTKICQVQLLICFQVIIFDIGIIIELYSFIDIILNSYEKYLIETWWKRINASDTFNTFLRYMAQIFQYFYSNY